MPPGAAALTGTVAGRFVILKLLGAGGMGQVYQAQDTKLKRVVAIKRMAPRLQQDERDRRRFLREAQQASALNHPNIASIYDVIEEQGEILLIMEYVEGTPLRAKLRAHQDFSTEEFFKVAVQGVEGLNAAHEKGILHGDIKPENIMLTPDGRVKVLDFGVARRFSLGNANEATLTVATLSGAMEGTPAYMAPEVLMQKPYDGRADLFSMGLVCYEMLGGKQPFETDSMAGTLASVLHTEPPPIKQLNPKVSSSVSAVVQTMLAKDPAQRYSTARDVLVDLRRVQQGEDPVFAHGAATWKKTKFKFSPPSLPKIAATIVATALIVGAAFFLARTLRKATREAGSNLAQSTGEKSATLVVLPFDAVSDDAKLTAFGNGLVNTLTAKLAQLSENHPLQVVSVGELRQKSVTDLAQARQEFGADKGLHVALQRSGDLVRVTYSLTDAKSGKVVKAGAADAPVTDPFAIEDQVTKAVAAGLGFSLRADETRELAFHGTSMPDAYNYYTQARGYLEDASKAASVDSAIILFGQALKVDPNYGRAEADLGSAYWAKYEATKDKSFIAKSRQVCSKAIDLGNAGAAGHVCLGVINSGTGKYEEAVDQFQRGAQLEPTNEDALIGLGGAYERLGKPQDAEATYKKIVQLRPRYWRGYNLLGIFYLRQAQYDDAAKMFQKVIERTPESFRGYANLGAAYIYEAKYAEAIKPLEQSLAIHETPLTYSNLGTAYYYLHRFKDAAQVNEKAVQLNDKDYLNWGNLAEALYLDGERDRSVRAFGRAIVLAKQELAVNPHDPEVLKCLANYHAMIEDHTRAVAYLNDELRQAKFDRDSMFEAALVFNHFGETGTSLEWLDKALRSGFSPEQVLRQPDLDNLHGDPRFQELLKASSSGPNQGK
jgi:tetratricopeptide (TPR) repeat protein/TolB-like protein/tRNA A-37 threonylcarbamoyl transferase component Bud32